MMPHPRSSVHRITSYPGTNNANHWPVEGMLSEGGEHYFVVLRGGRFRAEKPAHIGGSGDSRHRGKVASLGSMVRIDTFDLYHPIHPSTTIEDVEGATHAIDDGTHWHFAHIDPGTHADTELVIEALTLAAFQPQIENAMLARLGATDDAAKAKTSTILEGLYGFRNDVWKYVRVAFYGKHLGYFHKNEHSTGHYRGMISEAVTGVKSIWRGLPERREILPKITRQLASVELDLASHPSPPKTRTQKAIADAAAKAARERAAKDAEASEDDHEHEES